MKHTCKCSLLLNFEILAEDTILELQSCAHPARRKALFQEILVK